MNRNRNVAFAVALACGVSYGCASQTTTEKQFGDSVRATIQAQIYDGGAALSPSREAVTGGDPTRLENVLNSHRGDVAQPQQVQGPIDMDVGGGSRNR